MSVPAPEILDGVPVRPASRLVGRVAEARRQAGLRVPRWLVPALLLVVVSAFAFGALALWLWVGLAFVALGAAPAWTAWRSAAWPEATARVVDHEIVRTRASTSVGSGPALDSRVLYIVDALYTFDVAGAEVMGLASEAGVEPDARLEDAVRRARAEWAVGRTLSVRHHPTRPYAHTRRPAGIAAGLREGAVWLALGCAMVLAALVWEGIA